MRTYLFNKHLGLTPYGMVGLSNAIPRSGAGIRLAVFERSMPLGVTSTFAGRVVALGVAERLMDRFICRLVSAFGPICIAIGAGVGLDGPLFELIFAPATLTQSSVYRSSRSQGGLSSRQGWDGL